MRYQTDRSRLRSAGRRLATFGKDERAAAAVEFALVAVPFFALLFASLQLSLTFFAGQALQSAAIDASRQVMTGQAQSSSMTAAQFGQLVCSKAAWLFNCSGLMVDVQSAGSYSSISTAPPQITYDANGVVTNSWSWSPGGSGDVEIVRVMYNWPVFGPAGLGLSDQPGGNHLLVATIVFKNEPFPTT